MKVSSVRAAETAGRAFQGFDDTSSVNGQFEPKGGQGLPGGLLVLLVAPAGDSEAVDAPAVLADRASGHQRRAHRNGAQALARPGARRGCLVGAPASDRLVSPFSPTGALCLVWRGAGAAGAPFAGRGGWLTVREPHRVARASCRGMR